jgi:hypothetical protein
MFKRYCQENFDWLIAWILAEHFRINIRVGGRDRVRTCDPYHVKGIENQRNQVVTAKRPR